MLFLEFPHDSAVTAAPQAISPAFPPFKHRNGFSKWFDKQASFTNVLDKSSP